MNTHHSQAPVTVYTTTIQRRAKLNFSLLALLVFDIDTIASRCCSRFFFSFLCVVCWRYCVLCAFITFYVAKINHEPGRPTTKSVNIRTLKKFSFFFIETVSTETGYPGKTSKFTSDHLINAQQNKKHSCRGDSIVRAMRTQIHLHTHTLTNNSRSNDGAKTKIS